MRVRMGGVETDLLDFEEVRRRALDHLVASPPGERPLFLVSANLDHLHHARVGNLPPMPAVAEEVQWLVHLDGMPLVWVARRIAKRHVERVNGTDLLEALLADAAELNVRVGFLGGTRQQHEGLGRVLGQRHPGLAIAGCWAPSRDELTDTARSEELAAEIRRADVDLLVLSLGKPLPEQWMAAHGLATGARVVGSFGSGADYIAGVAVRAPRSWQRLGMEWLWRLVREPRRLGRRYLAQAPLAIWDLLTKSRT